MCVLMRQLVDPKGSMVDFNVFVAVRQSLGSLSLMRFGVKQKK
jgi:hypothetical protein